MSLNTEHQDQIVSQFCGMTGTLPPEARQFLDANDWDIEAAVTEFYAERDEALQDMNFGNGRRLGTDEDPLSSGGRSPGGSHGAHLQSTQQSQARQQKKFATLSDLSGGGAASENTDEDDDNQDFFAGGEKSGLAVQNPDDIKQKIMEKAMKAQPPPTDELATKKSFFTGAARTLGGDDTPSEVISDPTADQPHRPPRVHRVLHFWSDGFSVDDGDLYRSDDPRNASILEGIRRGRAPLSIMGVELGQEVDVEIRQHDEKYIKPKPKYKPFSGSGQRLGSPTPGIRTAQSASATLPTTTPAAEPLKPQVDDSQPIITLQVRLGDGTRLTSRFNTAHTIGDVYSFVTAASPGSQGRPWVLMTTFPSNELTDKSLVLGEMADFKRGGVVVQKWL